MLRPTYPIQTKRLLLRPLQPDDAASLYRYRSREDVCRYLLHPPQTLDQLVARIENSRSELTDEGQVLTLAAIERETGAFVGDLVLMWHSREHRCGEIGYVLDPEHAGKGYATEAGAALLRLGFDELGLHRITGRLDARNTASARVLEKLGLRREAHFVENEFIKGEWTDELVYATLATEWRDPS
ncbi:MAG TPA: GNAT family N-acetyltransferase [Jatrophihabitantaceae bacterium]